MVRTVPLLLTGLLVGCTATRSTVHLARAEQAVQLAREAAAPEQAPYAWTLAEQLVLKAREEWAASDFGASEALSKQALEQATEAASIARTAPKPLDIPDWADLPEAEDAPLAPAKPAKPAKPVAPAPTGSPWPEGTVTEGNAPGSAQ